MTLGGDTEKCPVCVDKPRDDEKWETNWIQCAACDQWFHLDCLAMTLDESNSIAQYHCGSCSRRRGPSVYKRKTKRQLKKIDYVSLNEGEELQYKFKHNHIANFEAFTMTQPVEELVHVVDVTKQDVTDAFIKKLISSYQNKRPILIPKINPNLYPENATHNRLDLKFPQLTVSKVAEIVGEDEPIEVMDVLTQNNSTNWNLGQWRDYYNRPAQDRDRIRNVISLEFSDTKLDEMIEIPQFVKDIDISEKLYVKGLLTSDRPKITKYCLMSVKDSFTDFHIDFGGTSVYYTVLRGHKSFIMFPPTLKNLKAYEAWGRSPDQGSTWFGDLVKPAYGETDPYYNNDGIKIDINPGDLLILPSGWIHAVYTSDDSLVIGGNFLTIYSIPTHLTIFEIERQIKVPEKFKLPNFTRIMWLIGYYYLYNLDPDDEPELFTLESLLFFYQLQLKGGRSYRSLIPTKKIGPTDKFVAAFTQFVSSRKAKLDSKHVKEEEPEMKVIKRKRV